MSGEDIHQAVAEQLEMLTHAGLRDALVVWNEALWAVFGGSVAGGADRLFSPV